MKTLGDNLGDVVISLSTKEAAEIPETIGLWPLEADEARDTKLGVFGVAGELGNSEIENTLALRLEGFFGVSIDKEIVPDGLELFPLQAI